MPITPIISSSFSFSGPTLVALDTGYLAGTIELIYPFATTVFHDLYAEFYDGRGVANGSDQFIASTQVPFGALTPSIINLTAVTGGRVALSFKVYNGATLVDNDLF